MFRKNHLWRTPPPSTTLRPLSGGSNGFNIAKKARQDKAQLKEQSPAKATKVKAIALKDLTKRQIKKATRREHKNVVASIIFSRQLKKALIN